jgi:hypothetical protein
VEQDVLISFVLICNMLEMNNGEKKDTPVLGIVFAAG